MTIIAATLDIPRQTAIGAPISSKTAKSPNRTSPGSRASAVSAAYYALNTDPKLPVTIKEMAEYMNVTERTARKWIEETGEYNWKKGCVSRIEK